MMGKITRIGDKEFEVLQIMHGGGCLGDIHTEPIEKLLKKGLIEDVSGGFISMKRYKLTEEGLEKFYTRRKK